jgi:alpha-galactosidase
VHIAAYTSRLLNRVGFFAHNDADMLEVGNGNVTIPEARSHFALWVAMKSPLLIGTDLERLDKGLVQVLANQYLLEFSQDGTVGESATPIMWDWTRRPEFWAGRYGDGRRLVLVVNYAEGDRRMGVSWGEVPGTTAGRRYRVTDVWTGAVACVGRLERVLMGHDTAGWVVGGEC